jgi:hypothetical protein
MQHTRFPDARLMRLAISAFCVGEQRQAITAGKAMAISTNSFW